MTVALSNNRILDLNVINYAFFYSFIVKAHAFFLKFFEYAVIFFPYLENEMQTHATGHVLNELKVCMGTSRGRQVCRNHMED